MLILYLLGLFHPTINTTIPTICIDPIHCSMYRGNDEPDELWDEGYDGEGFYCVVIG